MLHLHTTYVRLLNFRTTNKTYFSCDYFFFFFFSFRSTAIFFLPLLLCTHWCASGQNDHWTLRPLTIGHLVTDPWSLDTCSLVTWTLARWSLEHLLTGHLVLGHLVLAPGTLVKWPLVKRSRGASPGEAGQADSACWTRLTGAPLDRNRCPWRRRAPVGAPAGTCWDTPAQ